MKSVYASCILVLLFTVPAFAQNFLVVNLQQAKFAWDLSAPLQAGESWELRCTGLQGSSNIIKSGIIVMPYALSDVFAGNGKWSCAMHFVTAGGIVSSPSNTITVNVSGSKLMLEIP